MAKFLRQLFFACLFSFILVSICACSDDEPGNEQDNSPIKPATTKVELGSKDDLTQNIAITSSDAGWSADTEASWLEVSGSGSNLFIHAEPNPKAYQRRDIVNLKASDGTVLVQIEVAQNAASHYYGELFMGGFPTDNISANGRYAVGTDGGMAFVLDMIDVNDESNYTLLCQDANNFTSANGVSNDGIVAGSHEGVPAYWQNGIWTKLDLSAYGFAKDTDDIESSKGTLFAITPDGTTMVGMWGVMLGESYSNGEINLQEVPIIWKNGVVEVLDTPTLPRPGFPSSKLRGYVPTDISSDGSIIVGRSVDDYAHWVGATWTPGYGVYMTETYEYFENEYDQDGNKIDDLMCKYPLISGITPNGKYIYGELFSSANNSESKYQPYLYDIETRTYTLVDGYDNCRVSKATNDGTIFFGTPYREYNREGFVYKDGKVKTFSQWIWENYGIEVDNEITVTGVSEDMKVIVGIFKNSIGWCNKVFRFE